MATQLTEATLARGMRDDRLVSADPLADAGDVIAGLDRLTAASWEDMPGQTVLEALDQVEQASRRLEAVRARVVSAAHADGLWVLDGARSLTAWLRDRTGASTGAASRWVRESRALRDVLPATERALTDGRIGADHVHVLVRETIRTHALRAQLGDPQIGEDFLVEQAERLDATAFNTVAKAWATAADPEGADRAWREADAKEELTIAPTLGGFHVVGWLSEKTGRIVHRALDAHMGRRPEGDERTSSQRRVDALAALAHQSLDAGLQQASARRPPGGLGRACARM